MTFEHGTITEKPFFKKPQKGSWNLNLGWMSFTTLFTRLDVIHNFVYSAGCHSQLCLLSWMSFTTLFTRLDVIHNFVYSAGCCSQLCLLGWISFDGKPAKSRGDFPSVLRRSNHPEMPAAGDGKSRWTEKFHDVIFK